MPRLNNFKKSMPGHKDEFYTPRILVKPILPFIKKGSTVWCPFDTEKSEFVIAIKALGHKVVFSHLWNSQDFFNYEPEDYDCIISNPPFTKKKQVLERLFFLDKPFAMIMGLPILNYQEIGEFFLTHDGLQLLIVDKKVSFNGNTASFNNSYFCRRMLPQDIMFVHLPHNNTGKNFRGSNMGADAP